MRSSRDRMTIDLPEGTVGRATVEKVTVEDDEFDRIRAIISGSGRYAPAGTYTRLLVGGRLWMSDTPDEKRDHLTAVLACSRPEVRRVLINGLGLGMVVAAALTFDHIEHIDVVEADADVIALVAPHYEASGRVKVHHADAYEQCKAWPKGTTWDVAWHDIWINLCVDNLAEMARLHRSYGRRVGWQGSWGKDLLEAERRRDARSPWGW